MNYGEIFILTPKNNMSHKAVVRLTEIVVGIIPFGDHHGYRSVSTGVAHAYNRERTLGGPSCSILRSRTLTLFHNFGEILHFVCNVRVRVPTVHQLLIHTSPQCVLKHTKIVFFAFCTLNSMGRVVDTMSKNKQPGKQRLAIGFRNNLFNL